MSSVSLEVSDGRGGDDASVEALLTDGREDGDEEEDEGDEGTADVVALNSFIALSSIHRLGLPRYRRHAVQLMSAMRTGSCNQHSTSIWLDATLGQKCCTNE